MVGGFGRVVVFGEGVGGVVAAEDGGQGEVYGCWVAFFVGADEGDVGDEGGGEDGMDGLVVVCGCEWVVRVVVDCLERYWLPLCLYTLMVLRGV